MFGFVNFRSMWIELLDYYKFNLNEFGNKVFNFSIFILFSALIRIISAFSENSAILCLQAPQG